MKLDPKGLEAVDAALTAEDEVAGEIWRALEWMDNHEWDKARLRLKSALALLPDNDTDR